MLQDYDKEKNVVSPWYSATYRAQPAPAPQLIDTQWVRRIFY